MKCRICNSNNSSVFEGQVLGKYTIEYFHCSNCGFLQTESPFWLEEAYQKAINFSDVGYIQRNILYANKLSIILYFLVGAKGSFLDFAGGYGMFVRIMRDKGFNFKWSDKYCENLFAKGFEENNETYFHAITLFEVAEHLENPLEELNELKSKTDHIIISTELYPTYKPEPNRWWYFGLEHGQHISFFSEQTFEFIASGWGWNYQRLGSLHFLSKKKIPNWILKMTKGLRLGLDRWIEKKLNSKTWEDYHWISQNGLEDIDLLKIENNKN